MIYNKSVKKEIKKSDLLCSKDRSFERSNQDRTFLLQKRDDKADENSVAQQKETHGWSAEQISTGA